MSKQFMTWGGVPCNFWQCQSIGNDDCPDEGEGREGKKENEI